MAGRHFYEFGPFRLDRARRLLSQQGEAIPLTSKVLDTLLVLVENRGRVVDKEELMKAVWPDTFVEEGNLTQNISTLRKVLGESPTEHAYIETIPKRGYRFVAGVTGTAAGPWLSRRQALLWGAGVLGVLVIAAGTLWLLGQRTKSPAAALSVVPLTSYPGLEVQPSFSPDGSQLAFAWNGEKQDNFDIYVKLIGAEKPLRLTTDPAPDVSPAWSPDGRYIAFGRVRGAVTFLTGMMRGIFVIPAIGGPERKLAEAQTPYEDTDPLLTWSPDGKWLVISDRTPSEKVVSLFLLSIETGERRRLTYPPAHARGDGGPAFSPDGRTLAFIRVVTDGVSDLHLLPLSPDWVPKGEPRRLTRINTWTISPTWTPDGREIVFAAGPQYAGGLTLWRTRVNGSAVPRRLEFTADQSACPTISRQGSLAYARVLSDPNIWRVELSGPGGKAGPPKSFIASTRTDWNPKFSPDGKRIAFVSSRGGSPEIWVCDQDGSNAVQLTSMHASITGSPRWSPDGEGLVFDSNREGQFELYVIGANGGQPRRLTNHPAVDAVASWSRDGRWIYFRSDRTGQAQVWKMPARGGEAIQLTKQGGYVPFESSEGKFVYYERGASLRKVPVQGGEETQVLESVTFQNFAVVNEGIYFIPGPDREGRYSIQFLDFATGKSWPILRLSGAAERGLAVAPDGRTLLYTQIDQTGSDLMLVENFR